MSTPKAPSPKADDSFDPAKDNVEELIAKVIKRQKQLSLLIHDVVSYSPEEIRREINAGRLNVRILTQWFKETSAYLKETEGKPRGHVSTDDLITDKEADITAHINRANELYQALVSWGGFEISPFDEFEAEQAAFRKFSTDHGMPDISKSLNSQLVEITTIKKDLDTQIAGLSNEKRHCWMTNFNIDMGRDIPGRGYNADEAARIKRHARKIVTDAADLDKKMRAARAKMVQKTIDFMRERAKTEFHKMDTKKQAELRGEYDAVKKLLTDAEQPLKTGGILSTPSFGSIKTANDVLKNLIAKSDTFHDTIQKLPLEVRDPAQAKQKEKKARGEAAKAEKAKTAALKAAVTAAKKGPLMPTVLAPGVGLAPGARAPATPSATPSERRPGTPSKTPTVDRLSLGAVPDEEGEETPKATPTSRASRESKGSLDLGSRSPSPSREGEEDAEATPTSVEKDPKRKTERRDAGVASEDYDVTGGAEDIFGDIRPAPVDVDDTDAEAENDTPTTTSARAPSSSTPSTTVTSRTPSVSPLRSPARTPAGTPSATPRSLGTPAGTPPVTPRSPESVRSGTVSEPGTPSPTPKSSASLVSDIESPTSSRPIRFSPPKPKEELKIKPGPVPPKKGKFAVPPSDKPVKPSESKKSTEPSLSARKRRTGALGESHRVEDEEDEEKGKGVTIVSKHTKDKEKPGMLPGYGRVKEFLEEATDISIKGVKKIDQATYTKMVNETEESLEQRKTKDPDNYSSAALERVSKQEDVVTIGEDKITRSFKKTEGQTLGELHITLTSPPGDEALLFMILSNKKVVPLRMTSACDDVDVAFKIWQASILANNAVIMKESDLDLIRTDARYKPMFEARGEDPSAQEKFDKLFKKHIDEGSFKFGDVFTGEEPEEPSPTKPDRKSLNLRGAGGGGHS